MIFRKNLALPVTVRRGDNPAMRQALFVAFLACLLGGCAHYEYDLTQPAALTAHVATKVDTIVRVDPLEYRLQTVDNRLVVRIFNPSNDEIVLIGERSCVVDPEGQSHPLRGGSIPSQTYLKLIIPPMPPAMDEVGPSFNLTAVGGAFREPLYLMSDTIDCGEWDWSGEGDARVLLIFFLRGDKEFRQSFTFHRRKM